VTTAFKAVLGVIGAALSVPPALAEVLVNPRHLVSESRQRQIAVHLGQSKVSTSTIGVTRWTTPIVVECYARGEVDALLDAVWLRLFGPDASVTGAGIEGLEQVGIDWDYAEGRTEMECAALQILVLHRTAAQSLQPWI
jgi:hypothetical protein